ncbi:copper resistance protein CopC [[Brevibacterium] frigoritolerans]|uniref:Copper resistance protein CopC n=1 Tax=Peribacillus frigoritolerans TaxID=450367 RepID=A0A941FNL2_9BACI|nr:copper resistance protein CopC [Peribacillus frigoritolerans]
MKKYLWLIVSLFSLLLYPAMASGHATVISSNPSPNEAMDTLPEKITIQFSENIQPAFHSLEVYSQDGDKIQTQDSTISEQSEKYWKLSGRARSIKGFTILNGEWFRVMAILLKELSPFNSEIRQAYQIKINPK